METTALTFGAPDWFWLLAAIPLAAILFLWSHRRGRELVSKIVAPRLREQLAGSVSPLRRTVRAALMLAALVFAALALVACQRDLLTVDDLDVTLRPGVVVPLGALDLTLSDVFNPDSGLVTVDPDQTYRLVYRQTNLLDVAWPTSSSSPASPRWPRTSRRATSPCPT